MRNLALASLTATVLAAASMTAWAADLPVKARPMPAPVVPVSTWSGCYLGGNAGVGWGTGEIAISGVGGGLVQENGHNNTRFAGGGQLGCDWQSGAWVFGIRDM